MNIIFISISSLPHISEHSISLDLIHEFKKNGHDVYVLCSLDKNDERDTYLCEEDACKVLRVKIGKNKKANIIEKGITTVMLPKLYVSAVKKYFSDVKFDLVVYPTPPVTQVETVEYIKKRDGAKSYLLLKDIFPQNAVDLGMMSKTGIKGILYKYFRRKEKRLYAISDTIGCMSEANVNYVLEHNPEVPAEKVEVCPNSVEMQDMEITEEEKTFMREKYNLPLNKKIFVYGGNLGKPQGIPYIIECLKTQITNEQAFFLIVGDGTEYSKLEKFIEEYSPSNVRLMKRLPKEDYDKLVAACDVGLVFLDYRFTIPNFPSRILGYMQAGLPILACTDKNTDVGKTITDGGFGWWCESLKEEDFATAVNKALEVDCRLTGKAGKQFLIENYSAEKEYNIVMTANKELIYM